MSLIQQTLHEWRALLRLGAPILVAQLAQMANGFVDTLMAGNASSFDLAAVGIGVSFWVPLSLFFMGVLGALQPIIAEHNGAKRFDNIVPVAWQGIYIALIGSLGVMLLLWNVMPLVELFKADAKTAAIVEGYLQAFVWGVPALLLITALRGFTDGMGHTKVFMVVSLLGTLCNIPLNYIFIYGKFGMPELGGIGCGWATTGANMVALAAMLVYLHWGKANKNIHFFHTIHTPSVILIRRILKLGIPIGVTLFVEVSMFCAIAIFLMPLGAQTVAAHQIVLNATSMAFMVPLSLGMAVLLRVSYLVGEQTLGRARLVARSSLLLALAIACINVPILFFGRELLANMYTQEPEVVAIATRLLKLAAIFQLVDVLQVVAVNGLRGYQDTALPMWIIVLAFWGVCLPLGYVLAYTNIIISAAGAQGYWIALTVGLAIAAILLIWRLFAFKPTSTPPLST
ncbi:MATE family efflux transporter [Marinagarivorans algicola]|uniref:MATE family efflux transporter n=1 Tax=Marinagarivorans algicola TaxID=1513270 RepID=UPI0006B4DFBE|nr:MATE family efflux transporter [Marinagarivorans algicola]